MNILQILMIYILEILKNLFINRNKFKWLNEYDTTNIIALHDPICLFIALKYYK